MRCRYRLKILRKAFLLHTFKHVPMDINQVTEELDALFAQEKIDEIPQFLESHIAQAVEERTNASNSSSLS